MIVALMYRYEKAVNDPLAWQQHAQVLRRAAEHLMNVHRQALNSTIEDKSIDAWIWRQTDLELHRPALMLAAYSVEVLLKAVIKKKASTASAVEHHEWSDLAKDAGLEKDLNPETLAKLNEFALWKGRYPTSKAKKHSQDHLEKQRKHIEKVLKSKNAKFGDLRPLPGLDLPKAHYDHSAGPEDYAGSGSQQLFEEAMAMYAVIFAEWRR